MATVSQYTGEGFSFSHSYDKEPRDSYFPLHIHDSHELFCLVKGNVGYIVEGHKYKLYPGTLLIMRSSESHKLIVNESEEYERYVLNFSTEFLTSNTFDIKILAPFFERELGQKNRYLQNSLEGISPISFFEKIERESRVIPPQSAVLSNLSALLSSLNIAFLNKSNKDREENSIIAYINENLTGDISVSKIAEFAHLSPSQLSRNFKQLTGTSVYEYILSKRIVLFQNKVNSGIPVQRACSECGFRDYSSFYRLYKKRFNLSPTKKSQES